MTTLEQRLWRLAARQHWVVGLRQLKALGFSPAAIEHLIADGRLFRLHRGVYAVGRRSVTQRGDWMAAVIAVGAGALLSHHPAAALWDLRIRQPGPIDVTLHCKNRHPRQGIKTRRGALHPDDRAKIDGIPVTSIARTLLDLAGVLPAHQLQRTYERAQRLELLDLNALSNLLARSNGRRGVTPLKALLAYDPSAAAAAESELERMFIDLLREAELPTPQVGALVEGYLIDIYWPQAKLVVELDGYAFHSARDAFERDHHKRAALRLAGIEVLSFTFRQVDLDPAFVIDAVRRMLARASVSSPRPQRRSTI